MYILGIDLSTAGVKTIVYDNKGTIITRSERSVNFYSDGKLPDGWAEQDPNKWWESTSNCLEEIIKNLTISGIRPSTIKAISVASTSGTIVPVDKNGYALYNAIMFHDSRAVQESDKINKLSSLSTKKLGYKFKPTFALPHILWIKDNIPHIYERTYKFISATDFVIGKLSDVFTKSDPYNVLKMGYDFLERKWPEELFSLLDLSVDKFPEVIDAGKKIGNISTNLKDIGFDINTEVLTGCTDSIATFISSGITNYDQWNSNLGTKLSIKGLSRKIINDPKGRIYSYPFIDDMWIPGAGSNTGSGSLKKILSDNFYELRGKSQKYTKNDLLVYPLTEIGEMFPFVNPKAVGFGFKDEKNKGALYIGCLEGIAFLERWSYELLAELGAKIKNPIYSTGGGAMNDVWMQIRADVLNKEIVRPIEDGAALGVAIISASNIYGNILETTKNMVRLDKKIFRPRLKMRNYYDNKYQKFRHECKKRGYT